MSSYQEIRRRCLAAIRRCGADCVYLLASSGIVPVPPTSLNNPPARGTEPAGPNPVSAPLTVGEHHAWQQLVRELNAKPKRDRRRGLRSS
jgi:hypothetical protein